MSNEKAEWGALASEPLLAVEHHVFNIHFGSKAVIRRFSYLKIFLRRKWEKERGVGITLHLVVISQRLLCAKSGRSQH